jgi:gluconate 2-dehydrogenase gamma chain
MGQAEWVTVPISTRDVAGPLFFTDHEWDTVEAATARIIPTDHHPGAKEAGVVRFIDRMLAGTQFIFPAADGKGFLRMEGLEEKAWRARIEDRQRFYRDGVVELDTIASDTFGARFVRLDGEQQDKALELISQREKPARFAFTESGGQGSDGAPAGNQPVNEDFLEFFPLLVLNTRQGFYGDPVYGGNDNRVGWRVIGFPGPPSLESTMDGSYTTIEYMIPEAEWPYEQHPAVLRYGNR